MKVTRFFLYSAGVGLMFTAMAKFISSAGHGAILKTPDPLIGMPFRDILLLAAGIEAAIAVTCFLSSRIGLSAGLIAWLSTCLAMYRFSLWQIGWHKPCSCLGNLTDALQISPQLADNIMKAVLIYLLIGSYSTLLWLWRQKTKPPSSIPSSEAPASPV